MKEHARRPDETRFTQPSLGDRRRGTRRHRCGGRAKTRRRRIHRGTQGGRLVQPEPTLAGQALGRKSIGFF